MLFFYDIEIVPNYASFKFISNEKKEFLFEVYKDTNDIPMLVSFLRNPDVTTLVSYRGHEYDDLVLQWILTHYITLKSTTLANKKLKEVNDLIVHEFLSFDFVRKIKKSMYMNPLPFISIDLQKLHKLDDGRVSLKRIMIILKMDNVLEYEPSKVTMEDYHELIHLIGKYNTDKLDLLTNYSPDTFILHYNQLHYFEKLVLDRDVETMRVYNNHDVEALIVLYEKSKEELKLRVGIAKEFNISLNKIISLARSSAGEKLVIKFYAEESGTLPKEFLNLTNISTPFKLEEIVDGRIEFKTTILKDLLVEVKAHVATDTDKFKSSFIFDNTTYNFGGGGLHSKDKPGKFKSTELEDLEDADVSSYYPQIMENLVVAPRHLDAKSFLKMINKVKTKRLTSKNEYKKQLKLGNYVESLFIISEGLKIAINAIFGKLGEIGRWLYDLYAFNSVTINGQLYLLKLIEMLYLEGIHTISANTDGILCIVPKSRNVDYMRICKEWEVMFNFTLEFTKYDTYVRRDVNNYIAILDKNKGELKGNIKTKGIFSEVLELNKGYNHPITSQAIYQYVVNNIPVEKYIREGKDILDYCISINNSTAFHILTSDPYDNNKEVFLQRTNRYFASNKGKILYKRYKVPKVKKLANNKTTVVKEIKVLADSTIEIINKVEDLNPKLYNVNYRYYIREVQSIIGTINNTQQTLNLF